MHGAAQILVGPHDFTTFRSAHCQSDSPIKTLDRLEVSTVSGDAILRTALRSEGYYAGTPRITLAGEPPEAPNLAARLAARGAEAVPVTIGAEPGPLYRIGSVAVRPSVVRQGAPGPIDAPLSR